MSQAAWIALLSSPAIVTFLPETCFFSTTLPFYLVIAVSCLSLSALWGCSLKLREYKMFYNSNYAMHVSQQMSSTDRLALINLAEYKEGKWNLHPSKLFLVSQTVHLQKCCKQALGYVI